MKTILLILSFIWQLPQDLVAIVMMPFLGKMKMVRYENYCWAFVCKNMRGGISLGNFIFLSPYTGKREENIRHEFGHVKDSHLFGPLYLFIIGIPSLLWATFKKKGVCYFSFYTERRANKNAGLEVKETEHGCYLTIPE